MLHSHRWAASLEKLETECKRAEETLRELEKRYRALTDSSLRGVLIAQTPPYRFLFVNPTFAECVDSMPANRPFSDPQVWQVPGHWQNRGLRLSGS
ncbi:MAG TPA: hypothetical protein VEI04_09800, partial [Syntrophobacteria bacterium]|nr:hypothetical protein [Syntrophobacteria bacterium]